MASVSKACVFTMQDVMALGNEGRMNTPGIADGNWAWRVGAPGFFEGARGEAKRLAALAERYQRIASSGPQAPPKKAAAAVVEAAAKTAPSPAAPAAEEKKKFLGMF